MHMCLTRVTTRLANAASSLPIPDGGLFAWGNGEHGQLGLGDCVSRRVPEQITIPWATSNPQQRIVSIAAGWNQSAAVSGMHASPLARLRLAEFARRSSPITELT